MTVYFPSPLIASLFLSAVETRAEHEHPTRVHFNARLGKRYAFLGRNYAAEERE